MRRAGRYRRASMTAAVDCDHREKRRQCSYEVHEERRKTPWRRVNYRGGNSKAEALGYMVKAGSPNLLRSVLGFVMPAAERPFQGSPESTFLLLRIVRRRGASARLTRSDLLELRGLDTARELPFGLHMRDPHPEDHIGRRFTGGSRPIGRKHKRRHHDFVDRDGDSWGVWNFVRLRLRVGMNLVRGRELTDLNRGTRGRNFGRRWQVKVRRRRRRRFFSGLGAHRRDPEGRRREPPCRGGRDQ